MSKLVYSALALTLVSTTAFASENEWSSLDQEIANLSASLSAQNAPGPKLSGYMKTAYVNSSDDQSLATGEKESSFKLIKARIELSGDLGSDYSYKISFDLASGSADLKDAYVAWKVAENVKGTFGHFKQPFLRSSLISDKDTLFLTRTTLGELFGGRDDGLMFSGSFDTVNWWVAAQNGRNNKVGGTDHADDLMFTARLTANLMGAGVGKVEGAYGSTDETNLTAGIAFADDQSLEDGRHVAGEVYFTHGPFSGSFEVVDLDKGDSSGFFQKEYHWGSDNSDVSWDAADSTPWAATVSYMFNEMWEAMLRYENADDTEDSTAWFLGVNRYVQGHDIKWTFQYMSTKSDQNFFELDEWAIGLTVGI